MDQAAQVQFGAWLKQQRKSRRLTQEDLAERLACSSVLVQKIEAGERIPSAQLASLIGDWLVIPADDRAAFLDFARGQSEDREAASRFTPAPTPATRQSGLGSLPVPLTPLIGRASEVQAVQNLLLGKDARLMTLTGPPGIGKTRLALAVAHDALEHFRDGVFFVGLAPVVDPDLVLVTIAHALGLHDKSSQALLHSLQQLMRDKQMLLVLDNFEQVLDASPVVLELLETCPHLKILVTSREALHVHGEQQFHVPALATSDPTNLPDIETLISVPAVALFVDRAQAVKLDFVLTEENSKAIAAICTRLDGLPLAIELAAAHIRLFSPQEMLARLVSRLPLLTRGARNLPARQRTLRAAIDWSYNLLDQEERMLFARLGVFVGGFTLSAAEPICSSDAENDEPFDVAEGIESLLDKNLLMQQEGADGEWRFNMLELIRDYSLERLRASGEEEKVRGHYAIYFLDMAELASPEMLGGKQRMWLEKLEQEHDNLRGVLRWALNTGNSTLALRLGGAMGNFWYVHGHATEGRRWLEEAVAAGSNAPAPMRARALSALGHLHQQIPDHRRAIELCEESLVLYRKEGDLAGIASVLQILAFSAMQQGDPERAFALGKEAMALGFDPALRYQTIRLFFMLGSASWTQGDFVKAEEAAMNAVALSREEGSDESLAAGLNLLGLIAHFQEEYGRAEAFYRESISAAQRVGALVQRAHPTVNMGDLALLQGDLPRASSLLTEGLRLFAKLDDQQGIAEGLEGMACLAGAMGQPERAAYLFGAVEAWRETMNVRLPTFVRAVYERTMVDSRREMGEEAFAAAWAEGRAMSMEQAIDYALQEA